jgi:hypothetical protein
MTTDKHEAAAPVQAGACEADPDLQHWWRVIAILLDVPPARNGDSVKRRRADDGKQERRRSRRRAN